MSPFKLRGDCTGPLELVDSVPSWIRRSQARFGSCAPPCFEQSPIQGWTDLSKKV